MYKEIAGTESVFYSEKKELDTVVFVHGLGGDCKNTWGNFPRLIEADPQLPRLDIVSYGYDTSLYRRVGHDIKTEGLHLIGLLQAVLIDKNTIHLVGHSMGGLVILEGLVHEMTQQRANTFPSKSVSYISLFASPVSGSTAALMVKYTMGGFWWLNKHVRALARGVKRDNALDETINRIYRPIKNDSSARKIPIRMIMGTKDKVVSETDRLASTARYSENAPIQLKFDHFKIKEPESHGDIRYLALAKDLQLVITPRFYNLCKKIKKAGGANLNNLNHPDKVEFCVLYGELFQRYFNRWSVRNIWSFRLNKDDELYSRYLDLIVKFAATRECPPYRIAELALMAINRQFGPGH